MARRRPELRTPPAAALLLASLALAGCGEDAGPDATGAVAEAGLDPNQDGRVAYLLAPCATGGYYDVATADMMPILEQTLLHGHRDPLKRAKVELAAMGDEALPVLRRVIRNNWSVPDGKNHVRNALEAVLMSESDGARELLLEGLKHPNEDLRMLSVKGLRIHGRAEDYDALFAVLAQATPNFFTDVLAVMQHLDPDRAAALVLGWVEEQQFEQAWDELIPLVAGATSPEVVDRCRTAWPQAAPHHQPSLAAPCARAGDVEATRALDAWLVDPTNVNRRRFAAVALAAAGLADRLVPMLAGDPVAQNRLIAVGAMTRTPELTRELRAHVVAGIGDASMDVSLACLQALIAIEDPGALDSAIALLSGTEPNSLRDAMRLLGPPMAADEAVAERVFEVLRQRHEAEAQRPLTDRMRLLQAIGQVPLESAARLLLAEARVAQGELQGDRAERWLFLQIGNGGPASIPVLEALLDEDRDAVRRLDVLEALSMRGGEPARDAMLRFVEREDARPIEILYAADRLVRIGPARTVAPVLKRVTLRVSDRYVRPALQCLLWTAYPGPS